MSTILSFRSIENENDVYRGNHYMKKFCESLREHAMKIIDFKKKKMKLSTKEQQKIHENAKDCYICKEKFENKHLKYKRFRKLEIIVIIQGNTEVLDIAYGI